MTGSVCGVNSDVSLMTFLHGISLIRYFLSEILFHCLLSKFFSPCVTIPCNAFQEALLVVPKE